MLQYVELEKREVPFLMHGQPTEGEMQDVYLIYTYIDFRVGCLLLYLSSVETTDSKLSCRTKVLQVRCNQVTYRLHNSCVDTFQMPEEKIHTNICVETTS